MNNIHLPWQLDLAEPDFRIGEDGSLKTFDGRVDGMLALKATLYVEALDSAVFRAAVESVYWSCIREFGNFHWCGRTTSFPDSESFLPATCAPETLSDFLRNGKQIWFHDGQSAEDAGAYSLTASCQGTNVDRLSFLSISLPWTWAAAHTPDDYVSWVIQLCDSIAPTHGLAGPAVVTHPAGYYDGTGVYALARQFRGLEIDWPQVHEPYLAKERCIKGINWLTILNEEYLTTIGTKDWLSLKFANEAPIAHWWGSGARDNRGVIIRTSENPTIGAAGESLQSYQVVADMLRPLRTNQPWLMWQDGKFNLAEATRWLRRFDSALYPA